MNGQTNEKAGTRALARALATKVAEGSISADLLLEQAFERVIVYSPQLAAETVFQHEEYFSGIGRRDRLMQLLEELLIEQKRFKEAKELIRIALRLNWQTEAAQMIRLAKGLRQDGRVEEAGEILRAALDAHPYSTAALKGLYDCTSRNANYQEARSCLARLAAIDSSYSTMAYVFNERRKLPAIGPEVRIGLLSSYVIDWLVPYLDDECRHSGLSPQHYIAPFNQYMQVALDSGSEFYRFQPEIVFVALWLEDLFPALAQAPQEEELKQARSQIVDHVLNVVRGIESRCGAMIVVHEFVQSSRAGYGILDNRLPGGVEPWIASLNQTLAGQLQCHDRAYLLPLESVVAWVGKEGSHNPKLSYLASMRLGEPVLAELAKYSVRYVKALRGLTRKCVVVDLDGTLWGGIVGEVGLDGVALGPTGPGLAHLEFQRALLGLLRRGVLLAVCSKNNPDDALQVIRNHPYMVLKEEHFAAMRINWKNKAENIREIAGELNIGLDSLVFVDDNPNERELVRQLLPEVLTIDLPKDSSLYRRMSEGLAHFDRLALTREDETRAAQYQAQAKRQVSKNNAASVEEYLRSLEIAIEVGTASREGLARLVQLFNKTNQFNLTTKRYQTEDVSQFLASPEWRVYDLRVKDRFGDHGLVGVAVVLTKEDRWRIDSLLMSCRVMGLGVETAFLDRICRDASFVGEKTIVGEFIPTKKNHPVKEFYAQHGFYLDREECGRQEWVLDLVRATLKRPDWISIGGERTQDER